MSAALGRPEQARTEAEGEGTPVSAVPGRPQPSSLPLGGTGRGPKGAPVTLAHDSASAWVRGLLDMFAAQGVDGEQLLARAGIPASRLQDRHARFDVDEVSCLWELAVSASGNDALGMDRELAARHMDFDDVAYVMIACADLRSGLLEFRRYLDLLSSATAFGYQETGEGAWLSLNHVGTRRPVPWQRSAYSLLAVLAMCRWLVRRDIRPLAVEVRFESPGASAAAACQKAFGTAIRYGGQDHRMLLAHADLAATVPSQNPALFALHQRVIEERLSSLSSEAVRARVAETVRALLAQGSPRREDVAAQLGMTERALQRKLQQESTSFQHVVDETRREMAATLLADARRPIGNIAHLLGFNDESNFFRACRRWYGAAPGELRGRLQARP